MKAPRPPRALLVLLVLMLALAPRLTPRSTAEAATLTFAVTTTADAPDAQPGDGVCAALDGQCTLRAAVQEANAQPSGSTITVSVPSGTYALSLGALALISNTVVISGAGPRTTVLDAQAHSQVVTVGSKARAALVGVTLVRGTAGRGNGNGGGIDNAGALLLSYSALIGDVAGQGGGLYNGPGAHLIVTHAYLRSNTATGSGGGGGIANDSRGTLTLSNTTILSNTATSGGGGGIFNVGTMTLSNTAILSNTATNLYSTGGGIFNGGTLTLSSTAILNNTAGFGGGGIANDVGGTLTLSNTAILSNTATSGGGGIDNSRGTMTLSNTAILSNTADDGGGILNYDTLTLSSTAILSNTATGFNGGGIDNNGGTLTLSSTAILSNTATGSNGAGGGIFNGGGTLTLSNTAILSNTTSGSGGGIDNDNGGTLTLSNSTLSGNIAPPGQGGGIYNATSPFGFATTTLAYVTVAANSDGLVNAVGSPAGTVALTGTIVANSTSGPNCTGVMTEGQGYNLDSGASCGFAQPTDRSSANPLLGSLAFNGGPTPTRALLAGSPAIDHGGSSANGCPATDQRGVARPQGPACDIGAYELTP